MPRQIGLSPKLIPSVLTIIVGLVVALVLDREVGLGILGAGVVSLGAGSQLPPGAVTQPELPGEGSDARLGQDVLSRLEE